MPSTYWILRDNTCYWCAELIQREKKKKKKDMMPPWLSTSPKRETPSYTTPSLEAATRYLPQVVQYTFFYPFSLTPIPDNPLTTIQSPPFFRILSSKNPTLCPRGSLWQDLHGLDTSLHDYYIRPSAFPSTRRRRWHVWMWGGILRAVSIIPRR